MNEETKEPRIIAGCNIEELDIEECREGIVLQDRVIENYKKEIINLKTQLEVLKSAFLVVVSNTPERHDTFFFSKSQLREAKNTAVLHMILAESAQLPEPMVDALVFAELQRSRESSVLVLRPAEFLAQFTEVEISMARDRVLKGVLIKAVPRNGAAQGKPADVSIPTDVATDIENLVSLAEVRKKKESGK